ncbi:MAG: type II toxin-antitoxin system VapC family toxin [Gemmatimonadales bacterium]
MALRRYVLDTNCFIDAARDETFRAAFTRFCDAAAPSLFLSAVVAAELRAGAGDRKARGRLEREVFAPYLRRGRVLTPTDHSWEALGEILAELAERQGLRPGQTPRSFVFDVLIAQSCREVGAVLISRNTTDLERIAKLTPFEFMAPFPATG